MRKERLEIANDIRDLTQMLYEIIMSKENIDLPFGQTQSNICIENQLLLNIKQNRDDWWLFFYDSY